MTVFLPWVQLGRSLITRKYVLPSGTESLRDQSVSGDQSGERLFTARNGLRGRHGSSLILADARTSWHVANLPRNSIPTATGDNYRPRC